jgi:hypothetical protein
MLPPGGKSIVVNKYRITSYIIISFHIIKYAVTVGIDTNDSNKIKM